MGLVFLKERDQPQPVLRKKSSCKFLESIDIRSCSLLPKYHLCAFFIFSVSRTFEGNKQFESDLQKVGWKNRRAHICFFCLGLNDIVCPMFKVF